MPLDLCIIFEDPVDDYSSEETHMEMTLRRMTLEPEKIKPFMMWMSLSPIQGVWLDLDRRYGSKKKKKWKINTKNSGLPKFAPMVARTSLGPSF